MREVAGITRTLRRTAVTLAVQVYDDGDAVTPGADPVPKVTVVDGRGTTVVDDQEATIAGTLATYALTPSQTASVGILTATWTLETTNGQPVETFTTQHEIIGDHLFTVAELRASSNGELTEAKYSDALVRQVRDQVHDAFESITNHTWGLRAKREIHDGDGSQELFTHADDLVTLAAAATRVGQTWTAFDADQLADVQVYPHGVLFRESGTWPIGRLNIRADLEIGKPIPLDLRRAALRVTRGVLVPSNLPDQAIMQITEAGTFQLAVAGRRQAWFGIPEVDSVLARYRTAVVR